MKKNTLILITLIGILALTWTATLSARAADPLSPTPSAPMPADDRFDDPWQDRAAPRGPGIEAGQSPEIADLPALGLPSSGASAVQIIAGGLSFSCALMDSGGVQCWGDNVWGQLGNGTMINSAAPVTVIGLSNAVDLSAAYKHICALTQGGGVKCWGRNYHGELGDGSTTDRPYAVDVFGLTSGIKQVAAGGFHTCALTVAGTIKCWGVNWHGQLGDGEVLNTRVVPIDVLGLSGIHSIGVGRWHTCALTASGGVKCWGYNMFGQLGNGEIKMDNPVPVDVSGLSSGVASLALGVAHSCALMQNGTVQCWGDNSYGQIGDGRSDWALTPVTVPGLTDVHGLWTSGYHTCALQGNGQVKCWGDNWAGQIGDGTLVIRRSPVVLTDLPAPVTQIAPADSHTCAALQNGRAMCWGSNNFGQVGSGQTAMRLDAVTPSGLGSGVIAVASGLNHSCALTTGGAVLCWGGNDFGQVGDGTQLDRLSPVDVVGLGSGVTAIAAGDDFTCALVNARLKCWGANRFGQLGDGSNADSAVPVDVAEIGGAVVALSAGSDHVCALETGRVYCWGRNELGQLGDVTRYNRNRPVSTINLSEYYIVEVATGEAHSCARTTTGKILCWGWNFYGQLGSDGGEVLTYAIDVEHQDFEAAKVDVGRYHTCALSVAGQMWCWGSNSSGQLGNGSQSGTNRPSLVPRMEHSVAFISLGKLHTCSILTDGKTSCWGDNWQGQLGDGTTSSRYEAVEVSVVAPGSIDIAAGDVHTCAVTAAGGARCWGGNSFGQLGDGSVPWYTTPTPVKGLFATNLAINYSDGSPGSSFTVTGSGFWPNASLTVQVNGHTLTPQVQSDAAGALTFLFDTSLAEDGAYYVTLSGYPDLSLHFKLDAAAPLRPPDDSGPVLVLPPGIALTEWVYLPLIVR